MRKRVPRSEVGTSPSMRAMSTVMLSGPPRSRARSAAVRTGKESMIGAEVEVLDAFSGTGRVRAFGEIWQASATAPVTAGERVRVIDVDGLRGNVARDCVWNVEFKTIYMESKRLSGFR